MPRMVRVSRVLGAYGAGRILNAKTARSQLIGGMTFGVSSVLHDPQLRGALLQSLKLSSLTVLIAVPFGVGFALALDRWRGRGSHR